MDKYKLITAILQVVGGAVLAGISAYYYVIDNMLNFAMFLGIGVIFVALGAFSTYKWWRAKKKKDGETGEDKKQ